MWQQPYTQIDWRCGRGRDDAQQRVGQCAAAQQPILLSGRMLDRQFVGE
ncbi:MAG TPA: hypothetical protein VLS48_09275 [Anaerolineales bacterium]|nr:hypothetical protein [Anaerolineales bacterium]